MIANIVLSVAIGVNCGCAALNLMMYRRWRRRVDELERFQQTALPALIESFAPAVAFCLALRDNPNTPEGLRRQAGEAIPHNEYVHIKSVGMVANSDKVH